LDFLLSNLEKGGTNYHVWDGVVSNPDAGSVREGVGVAERARPEALVAVGGGSTLDTAKAISACLGNDTQYVFSLVGTKELRSGPPVFCLPTTSGTGSEVSYWAVITDRGTHEKLSLGDPAFSPALAIVDPELTLTLPPRLTLWTGLDALTHAVEAFLSTLASPLSDLLSREAISVCVRSLGRAVEQGDDLKARGDMALASLLAGAAMQHVGLGLVHAISHQVSGFYDTQHGLANALLLPHVLEFNTPECLEKRKVLDGLTESGNFLGWLKDLYEKHALEAEAVEIKEKDIPIMAERAKDNVNAFTNPRRAEVQDIMELQRRSFKVIG
jgi:alcohol dehydrogenase